MVRSGTNVTTRLLFLTFRSGVGTEQHGTAVYSAVTGSGLRGSWPGPVYIPSERRPLNSSVRCGQGGVTRCTVTSSLVPLYLQCSGIDYLLFYLVIM